MSVPIRAFSVQVAVLEGVLGVPGDELESLPRRTLAETVPVFPRPVRVGAVGVEDDVVGESDHVDVLLELRVVVWIGEVGVRDGVRHVVGVGATVQEFELVGHRATRGTKTRVLHRIKVVFSAIEVRGGVVGVGALGGIVDTPVESVEIEMHPRAARGGLPHRKLGLAQHQVPQVIRPHRGIDPGVGEDGLQNQPIKFVHLPFPTERKVELGFPEFPPEEEREGLLGSGTVMAAPSTGNPDRAIDLGLRTTTAGINPFHRTTPVGLEWILGVDPAAVDAAEGIGENTFTRKQVIRVGHDRKRGQ